VKLNFWFNYTQIGEPIQQRIKTDLRLQAGERRTDTEVTPTTKRYVLMFVLPLQIELGRILELIFISVRR